MHKEYGEFFKSLTKKKSTKIAVLFLLIISLISILSWLNIKLTTYDFDQTTPDLFCFPNFQHPFGTDNLGRDLLARIIYGSRLSLLIGYSVAVIAGLIGSLYGAIAGYWEGVLDLALMSVIDIIYSLPDLLVLLLLGLIFGKSTFGIVLSLSLITWMGVARIVRSNFIRLKNEDFVIAAKTLGASDWYVIFKHIFPNTVSSLIVTLFITIPQAILAESTLSFIGLGLDAPQCSWGTLTSDGFSSLKTHPYLLFFPAICIFFSVLSLNVIGDNLRDTLDPKTKKEA